MYWVKEGGKLLFAVLFFALMLVVMFMLLGWAIGAFVPSDRNIFDLIEHIGKAWRGE